MLLQKKFPHAAVGNVRRELLLTLRFCICSINSLRLISGFGGKKIFRLRATQQKMFVSAGSLVLHSGNLQVLLF